MFENRKMLKENFLKIAAVLAQAPGKVELLAVSKNVEVEQIEKALALGIKTIGENRIQEAARKFPLLQLPCAKHMIGHLQSNKVRQALEIFDLIESVDSVHLAEKISKEASKEITIFLEVNIAEEEQKYGFKTQELKSALGKIKKLPNLKVQGLMCMAPFTEQAEDSRGYFREMKKMADTLGLTELSMGTSQDWQVAVSEGATIVRIGQALFA